MKPIFFTMCAALFLCGCSIHPKKQLTAIRAAGVPAETVRHLSENAPLTPADLVDLKRRGVDDSVAVLHLDRVGLDYEAKKDDLARLRAANVSDSVRDAFSRASDRFVYWRYHAPRVIYADPYLWHDPFNYGFGFTYVRHSHRHSHRHCR